MKKIASSFTDNNNITATHSSPSFSDDILCEILSRVPTKLLKQFKLVCKRWRSIIKDPIFGALHFSRFQPTLDDTTLLIHPLGISQEHAGESPILFTLNLFGGGSPVPLKVDLGRPVDEIRMLKPVKGLVCFVHDTSVLIFNPCTGERTSWIKVTTSLSVGKEDEEGKMMRYYYGFGFGFDETTNKHKVVCICEIFSKPRTNNGSSPPADRRVCEVLTVGDNTWRKIDKVPPPYNLNQDEDSLYVDGSIFWLDDNPSRQVIVAFDVGREEFRTITISSKMQEYWCSGMPLVDVHGEMGVLDLVSNICIKYWGSPYFRDWPEYGSTSSRTCHSWSEYSIYFPPCPWDGNQYLAFQSIEETELIILQSFYEPIKLESLYYFEQWNEGDDRVKQVPITGMSSFPTPKFGYEIRTFVECLLPVQNQQH